MVARLNWIAVTTPVSAPEISVMSDDSIATSVPVPIARPMSACASAGASLMPSPTIATRLPSDCSRLTSAALRSGRTSARTRPMPTWRAMAAAVRRLSPVIITTSRPSARRPARAATDSSLSVSATARTPAGLPSMATSSGVLPSSESRLASTSRAPTSMPASRNRAGFPIRTERPSTVVRTPLPVTESKWDGSLMTISRDRAPATTAAASGCSEERSADAARRRSSSLSTPSVASTSVSAGRPRVIVPVLSRTIVSSLWAVSRASAERIRMPCSAPFPVLTITESGVARPRAQGQAMISTATALTMADVNAGCGPSRNHATKVQIAIPITAGTK